ncbi:rho GTPase-activating protein 4-like [Neosynchiropus ocellatus]
MSTHVKFKKERAGAVDHDTQVKEVRCQLVEQLKVLDLQLEQKSQQLQDLSEYLRRRGELESEYSRSLEKLAERFTNRTKRKDPSGLSVSRLWQALLAQTRQESRDHGGLGDACANVLVQPLALCQESTQRLAKKSKEMCALLQDGLLKVTAELQTAWRTYHQYHSDFVSAEGKLKEAEKQKQSAKKLERLIEKRQGKVQDIHLKVSKARNDYLLNLAAANASVHKYYLQDVAALVDCADLGYHLSLSRVMQAFLSRQDQVQQNLSSGLRQLRASVSGLDQSQDREALLQEHPSGFCLPARFLYQPHEGDQVSQVSAEGEVRCELETRFRQIQARLKAVGEETEEAGRLMSSARLTLLDGIGEVDLSSGSTPDAGGENQPSRPSAARRRATLVETETLFLSNMKELLVSSSLASKLKAKHDLLKEAVGKEAANGHQPRSNRKHFRKAQSSTGLLHNQKLFGGDILPFIQASGQQVPLIVESCVRYINLSGLQHEGIFRVPGSQTEVNALRDAFERGDDPLEEQNYELDSVAGVLKLYFRGLQNPLFPVDSTGALLEAAQSKDEAERAAQLRRVVLSFPPPLVVVMRFLFAFLHHVTQYGDENMMQPYNLAVCFGPSLVRGASDDDAVTLQPQINDLVKSLIVQQESIFPGREEVPGPVYEKCMTLEPDDCEPVAEEGEADAEGCQSRAEVERGPPATDPSERPGAASEPAGGASVAGTKRMLQLPSGPLGRQRRGPGPGYARKETPLQGLPEDAVRVDKEVCRQMDSVFRELLTKQALQDPSAAGVAGPGRGAGPD